MKEKEKEIKNTNELIPELIIKINKYSSKLKDRVKIDSIFRELDSYAHTNFQNFIKMSEKRYKYVKSGNNIKNILSNQKKECNEISNKILSNNLYLDNNIEKESKKLYKKINKKKDNKELYEIRRNIIERTKNFTTKEIKRREKYVSSGEKAKGKDKGTKLGKQNKQNKKEDNVDAPKLEWIYRPKYNNIINKFAHSNSAIIIERINKINDSNDNKDQLLIKKNYFDNLLLKDKQNLNNNITHYKEYLKDIEKSKDKDINKIINSGNTFGHTYSFQFKDIKLLSFKEEKKEDVKIGKKENPEIDIVKLVRYTKRGNRKWFKNNIKLRSKNRLNSFMKNFHKKKLPKSSSAIDIGKKHLEEINIKKYENSDNNDNNMMGATCSTAFSNFKNTLKTVKNEAEMIKYIDQNFDIKRNTMEGFFKRNTLPKLEDYEIMFKTRNNFRNMNINNNSEKKVNDINKNLEKKNNYNSFNKYELRNRLINKDIYDSFKKTYNNKKLEWEEEDIQKAKIKKKEQELIEETKKYLKDIQKIKRKAHLYVDPYSKRDEIINERIKLFTRSLSGPFYSKKQMESKINDFNNYIEMKEIEKKKNDEKLAKTLKEEELKRREEDEDYKLMAKIKKNFEKESKNRNENNAEDINLNYKFISTLKMGKNNNKGQPYKDYMEFMEIVKEKKRNGEYDVCGMKNE